METTTDNLKIENPCPFVPTRKNKVGTNFFCKSCSKTIVDFRNKSVDEIEHSINKNTCGIFTFDQLPAQLPMKSTRKLLFYSLSILSLLGFSVAPLSAQTTETQGPKKNHALVDNTSNNQDSLKVNSTTSKKPNSKTGKKSLFRRKKKPHRVIGCPSF